MTLREALNIGKFIKRRDKASWLHPINKKYYTRQDILADDWEVLICEKHNLVAQSVPLIGNYNYCITCDIDEDSIDHDVLKDLDQTDGDLIKKYEVELVKEAERAAAGYGPNAQYPISEKSETEPCEVCKPYWTKCRCEDD